MAPSRFVKQPGPLSSHSVRFSQNLLVPAQQPTRLKLTKRTDFYEQRCVKYPDRACFHCYAEFIHALLLEADPSVTSFVPQPYQMEVNRKPYVPDIYVVRDSRIEVLELKPRGQFDPKKAGPLSAFFDQYGMHFDVIANEAVFEQESLALHWLPIVQVLAQAHYQGLDTDEAEQRLFDAARDETAMTVGDLLGDAPREERYWTELALYRLLHRHDLHCDLSDASLDYDTEVTAWS
ncbi:hypothetical protein [Marinobacter sp. ATCH36]|uniref:hypothetical protein n=1 Tax=Marinobacter sp. ATCH36 TaxID=2945106 RepID=UPI0020225FC6|nr:hypothetical protein [Marinobacter sp. ATCH36]